MKDNIESLNNLIAGLDLEAALQAVSSKFSTPKLSIGMGKEGQVLTDMIFRKKIDIEVFTLDTGRLFPETYELIEKTTARYGRDIKVFYPNQDMTQELVQQQGINGFYNSIQSRQNCCFVRKVEPLNRALKDADLWITGLRADQSPNRSTMQIFEWDDVKGVMKFNPILKWTEGQVEAYITKYNVPVNTLHNKGFTSIGCAPCTRAIELGEHPRAGRWWWEKSQKECGLHQVNSQLVTA